MPLYSYICLECGYELNDQFKKFSNAGDIVECAKCNSPMIKSVHTPNFIKGDGFWADKPAKVETPQA